MKYFLSLILSFLFLTSPLYAQRVAKDFTKDEEKKEKVDNRKDLALMQRKQDFSCGGNDSFPFALVGNLYYPPFSWTTTKIVNDREHVTLHGIGVDFFKHVLDKTFKESFTSENIIVDSNEEIDKAMLRGYADIHVDTFYDNDPKKGEDYIFPSYISAHMVVVTRKDDGKTIIKTLEDFKKYKGVIKQEENAEWIYESIGIDTNDNDKLMIIKSSKDGSKEALTALLDGSVDYFFTNLYSAKAEISRYKLHNELKVDEDNVLKRNTVFFAVSKLSECRILKDDIEEGIKDILINHKDEFIEIVRNNIKKYISLHKNEKKLVVDKKENNNDENQTLTKEQ